MSQTQASDQWAYFQAKSIKSYIYEMQKDKLELELKTTDKMSPQATAEYAKKIEEYEKKSKKYETEKNEIQAGANSTLSH